MENLLQAGTVHDGLLEHLDQLDYYGMPFPKSLDNSFGIETILPIVESYGQLHTSDALCTYVEHMVTQIAKAVEQLDKTFTISNKQILTTGGGAFNTYLVSRLQQVLEPLGYSIEVPDNHIVQYKEGLIMALLGLLRWREENTVLHSVSGASRSSIGGAVWIGQDA